MRVIKRSGSFENIAFEKIAERMKRLSWGKISDVIDVGKLVSQIACGMCDGITTEQIDRHAADIAIGMESDDPAYGILASRIAVSNLHKKTCESVVETYDKLRDVISPSFLSMVREHAEVLQTMVVYSRDYDLDYFGVQTMERLYCTKLHGVTVERPQHVFLRTALAVCGGDMDRVKESYDLMSTGHFTHASPTLFNAGMKIQQMASCFLLGMDDSLDDIFDTLHDCARISKHGGGLGVHISAVRSKGAPITSTNGASDGVVPMLKVANDVVSYVNQSGKRKGSMAVYLEPHHPDVMDFLELRRPGGDETMRCRDLFMALWVSDLFMKRVERGDMWSFFDPFLCPGLQDAVGEKYVTLYETYERQGKAHSSMPARDVWHAIIRSQIESGVPYLMSKDAVNLKSNQQNLGTIKGSNLCAEIVEYTSKNEIAVCTLASIALPAYVDPDTKQFNFEKLHRVTKIVARNLNDIIDLNAYPVEQARNSNMRHRPIGVGVQGLADVFVALGMPYESEDARALNIKIFAFMYHAAIEASTELAERNGVYDTYVGSPASQGKLQYALWNVAPHPELDWETLEKRVSMHGLRNSMSIALMPTASTAQVLGNTEACEPPTSMFYIRRTLAGEYTCIYKPLFRELCMRGLWNKHIKNKIIRNGGSIQNIPEIPYDLKALFKTAWDIKQRALIDLAADRGPYICQTASQNLFLASPTYSKLTAMHFHSWRKGLKTWLYYLRTQPASQANQVTALETCDSCSA